MPPTSNFCGPFSNDHLPPSWNYERALPGVVSDGGLGDCSFSARGFPNRQYWLSGHWPQWPVSPQTYVPRSLGQLCHA
jgi:hypothetical protein